MQIITDAIVLKVSDVGENDRLLTLLTKEYGVLKAFASGAKKIKNKYHTGTSHLCYSHFILEHVKGTYRVRDASLNTCFFKIGCDITHISLQQYFCELCATLGPEESSSEGLLRLLLNSLYCLNENKVTQILLKPIFELRMLSILGYTPDLIACSECAEFDNDIFYFGLDEGVLFCEKCVVNKNTSVAVDRTILASMRHIIYCDFENLFSFSIPEVSARRLSRITEKYLIYQTEQRFSTLDFYNSLGV